MKLDNFELTLYAVRSQDGKWYKSRGQSGSGPRWVDGVDAAKIYTRPGPAKSVVTWWSINYPKYGVPDIVEITAKDAKIVSQSDRVKKVKNKKAEDSLAKALKNDLKKMEDIKKRVEDSKAELEKLKKGN